MPPPTAAPQLSDARLHGLVKDGTLGEQPLYQVLAHALDARFVGSVQLIDLLGQRHTIYFDDGVPCQAHTPNPIAPLSAVLRKLGLLDEQTLSDCCARSGYNSILLARELRMRDLLSATQLRNALGLQLTARVRAFMRLPRYTRFHVTSGRNLVPGGEHGVLTPCNPLPLITEAVRRLSDVLPIDEALASLGDAHLSIHPYAPIGTLGLERERPIVEALLRRSMTLAELRASVVAADAVSEQASEQASEQVSEQVSEEVLRSSLYLLIVTRCLLVVQESYPPPPGTAPLTPPPRTYIELEAS